MKIFKSKEDKYGWRLRIHLLKSDNCLRIWREKKGSDNYWGIDLWEEEDIKVLKEALKEREKQLTNSEEIEK